MQLFLNLLYLKIETNHWSGPNNIDDVLIQERQHNKCHTSYFCLYSLRGMSITNRFSESSQTCPHPSEVFLQILPPIENLIKPTKYPV